MTADRRGDVRGGESRGAILIVVAASLIQLVVGALGPLDGDETLYWEWSRHLAWGYFDHPPGIALLIRIGVGLFGVNAFGVRCMAVLANLGGAIIVVTLARRLGGERAALRSAVIVSCLPIMTNWLMLATPDSALFLTAMGVVLLVDNALGEAAGSGASLRWWLLAGIALGLAALAKELAILIPVAIVMACLTHGQLRARLAEPGPYLACLIAAVMIVPLVLWNRDHGWILLQFALQRGLGVEHGGALSRELEYIGGQAAIATPFLCGLFGFAVYRAIGGPGDPRRHLIGTLSFVTFGGFAAAALRHQVEPNWAMLAYPAATILLATSTDARATGRWLNGSLLLGGGIVVLLYLHTAVGILPIPPLDDPIRRGHGWSELAERVDAARRSLGARATWIAGNRFQDASQLAFHLDGHPFVFSLNIESRANQYDFWPGFSQVAKPGDGLILVLDDSVEAGVAHGLAKYFSQLSAGERVVPGGDRPTLAPKRIWILEGWLGGWPARR